MKEDPRALKLRDLPEWLQDKLRQLSYEGFLYLGRTGTGLTHLFRYTCMKVGTIKALSQALEHHDLEDRILVEMIAVEGPKWVPYTRILEYCTAGEYETIRQKE